MMKIIYALSLTIGLTAAANAQLDTVTFENFSLTPESHNNGDDLSGGFLEDGVHFSNYYDTTYYYFSGFAISNETDVTTAGYLNQFSSFSGGGDNSSNFAVYYPSGVVDLGQGLNQLISMRVTNTTYAGLSMQMGDSYAKKFGDSTDAYGVLDGTNGEDFFKLKIISLDVNLDTVGSTEVYLADFRFADNSQDYVLDTWKDVDLIGLNSAAGLNPRYLHFELSSSDNGTFGMNTPAYFAMDNLILEHSIVGLSELEANIQVYPNPVNDLLNIGNAFGQILITDAAGKILTTLDSKGQVSIDFSAFSKGTYFVTLLNDQGKTTQKVIK